MQQVTYQIEVDQAELEVIRKALVAYWVSRSVKEGEQVTQILERLT
jgi:hypothetical protein